MLSPEIISEISEEKIVITKAQMDSIYEEVMLIPKYDMQEVAEGLYDEIIEKADGRLKNHVLGQTIFHLYKIGRHGTRIGLEKLIYAALIIDKNIITDVLKDIDDECFQIGLGITGIIDKK
jgi:hypothetical protein